MRKNCPKEMRVFINAALHCTGEGFNPEYYEDEEEVTRFTEIEDFIKAANFLEISNTLASFQLRINNRDIGNMVSLWKARLHIMSGFCYTIESKEAPVYMDDEFGVFVALSKLVLDLDVSVIVFMS